MYLDCLLSSYYIDCVECHLVLGVVHLCHVVVVVVVAAVAEVAVLDLLWKVVAHKNYYSNSKFVAILLYYP